MKYILTCKALYVLLGKCFCVTQSSLTEKQLNPESQQVFIKGLK